MGRISKKVFIGSMMTSVVAVLMGMLVFQSCQPLIRTKDYMVSYIGYELSDIGLGSSLLEMIVNIMPTNIVSPFSNSNAMQLLVLALLGGIALGGTGQYSTRLREAADALDSFFSRTAEIVSNMIPIATFFATILSAAHLDFDLFLIPAELLLLTVLGIVGMLLCYCAIVFACSLNPLTFLRKFAPSVVGTFLNGSGMRVIPETMRVCDKKFGVSPKVYSFSIPFGAIANLDGNCVYLTIAGLYMANLCGASFFGNSLPTIIFVVLLLSIGAPITPGSVMVTATILMNTMGLSLEGLCFVIGVNVIIEMILAVCNTVGDVAITLVVARTEGLLDLNVYRGKPAERAQGK